MSRRNGLALRRVALVLILVTAAAGLVLLLTAHGRTLIYREAKPQGIMGTEVQLQAVVPTGQEPLADAALQQAEGELRRVEALLSPYRQGSDIWRLNAAKAGQRVPLSAETIDLLTMGQQLSDQTDGALDITCGALLKLWKDAGQHDRLPTAAEIAAARANVGFDKLTLREDCAIKQAPGLIVDPSAIVKKYAIDKAVELMKRSGVTGGMVNVGGDLRVFGRPAKGDAWEVQIVDPFDTTADLASRRILGTLAVNDCAVVTSGNYERYVTIDGRTYSHIVDPRTGQPCDHVPSVTIVGPEAICGTWATTLSVLGWQKGHPLLPHGTVAMVVEGDAQSHIAHYDEAFADLLEDKGVVKQWSTTTTAPTSAPADK